MTPSALENRLLLATGMWREATDDPLPKMPPGDPEAQVERFELELVELLCAEATPETARSVAERTWDLVHDRPAEDPVRQLVEKRHEELAELSSRRDAGGGENGAGAQP